MLWVNPATNIAVVNSNTINAGVTFRYYIYDLLNPPANKFVEYGINPEMKISIFTELQFDDNKVYYTGGKKLLYHN